MDSFQIENLKKFVDTCENDMTILSSPDLGFFREFLTRLGAKIPHSRASTAIADSGVIKESSTQTFDKVIPLKEIRGSELGFTGGYELPGQEEEDLTTERAIPRHVQDRTSEKLVADRTNQGTSGSLPEPVARDDGVEVTVNDGNVTNGEATKRSELSESRTARGIEDQRRRNVGPQQNDNRNEVVRRGEMTKRAVGKNKVIASTEGVKVKSSGNREQADLNSVVLRGAIGMAEVDKKHIIASTRSGGYALRSVIQVNALGTSGVSSNLKDKHRALIMREDMKYPTSRTPHYARRKKADAPRSKVQRVQTNSGTATGPTSLSTNPLIEAAVATNEIPANPANEVGLDNNENIAEGGMTTSETAVNPVSEAGLPESENIAESGRVSNPLEALDVFDNSAGCDSDPDQVYVGWEYHMIKSHTAFNKRWLRYKAIARWLKAQEVCCMLLNPEHFDKFEADAANMEFGVHLIDQKELDKEMKFFDRAPASRQPDPVMVGPYQINIEIFVSKGRERYVAQLDDKPLCLMQTRFLGIPGHHFRCFYINEKLADVLREIEESVSSLVPSMRKKLPSSTGNG